jgi:predicted nucleic acid-binding protein
VTTVFRAVLDANVFVSAAIHPDGPPGRIVEQFLRTDAFTLVLSEAIVDEVMRARAYPKVRR